MNYKRYWRLFVKETLELNIEEKLERKQKKKLIEEVTKRIINDDYFWEAIEISVLDTFSIVKEEKEK